jgi:hypothetical protein
MKEIDDIWEIAAEALACEGEEKRPKYTREELVAAMAKIVGIIDDMEE